MTWLPNDFLRKMIADKVVLPPETTACRIPAGIFENVEGAMVQSIAYGEELNLVHPPRPADPKVAWEQIWTARVRVKSTGMLPLGMGDEGETRGRRRAAPLPAARRREAVRRDAAAGGQAAHPRRPRDRSGQGAEGPVQVLMAPRIVHRGSR